MIWEWWQHRTTPCPQWAREMGYLDGSIGLATRHRRCRKAWSPHLERCRSFMVESAIKCPHKKRAGILGSGWLYDVPLARLAEIFEEVVLVDMIHPNPVRKLAQSFTNVRLVQGDASGFAKKIYEIGKRVELSGEVPCDGWGEPDICFGDDGWDWVASCNLLSQLSHPLCEWLERSWGAGGERIFSDEIVSSLETHVAASHLETLRSLAPSRCLITDVEEELWDERTGVVSASESILPPVQMPQPDAVWYWDIAPRGEVDFSWSRRHRVAAASF